MGKVKKSKRLNNNHPIFSKWIFLVVLTVAVVGVVALQFSNAASGPRKRAIITTSSKQYEQVRRLGCVKVHVGYQLPNDRRWHYQSKHTNCRGRNKGRAVFVLPARADNLYSFTAFRYAGCADLVGESRRNMRQKNRYPYYYTDYIYDVDTRCHNV